MKKSFRSMLALISLITVMALVTACGGGSGNAANSGNTAGAGNTATTEPTATPEVKTGGEVNIYTARHYDVDSELYAKFTEATGIKVNVVEGKAPELIERIKREGASTTADLFITVDGGILNTAKTEGLLQPVVSTVIDEQVPAELRDKDSEWIGLSTRARVIVYVKDRVDPSQLSTYEDLATEKWKGKLLVRSSENLYNQSLLASFIALNGEAATEQWAAGIAANLARDPEGGDRDQAKGIVAGVGDVAIMNTYYVGQLSVSQDAEEVKVAEQIGVFFPNQDTTGTHINISGAGLIKHSPNKDNALKLIEFLTAPEAQEMFSSANFEFPVNKAAAIPELLKSWGEFKHQSIDFAAYGEFNPKAVEIANKVGWK
ncbi:Fe(3+) ABC transporter substrate-binding protein [Paenibacillus sp. FSL H8-0548]|uniref:Fe(3+) ABC transporter substrate-binding protein n=1 Tax=Paenibacillus sp. FSL H8-0548 TaxID=1920422 RepID=UPI00096C7CA6|nr:Fe(3+) ABC transporter substrate-binding protein [Paenibacillus sp. FSL H8-0548]OMF37703.1 Fe(3+) ABC transporter substrate-binding protein [Paenibacillus sp. FSL H8-0548]